MTHAELLERIARGATCEDTFVECKLDGLGHREIRKTIVAFANSVPDGREAILFVGVADDGRIVGVRNPDAMQKKIRQICEQDCYPPIKNVPEVIATSDGPVVAVVIPASQNRRKRQLKSALS